jgi:hypothetical protein
MKAFFSRDRCVLLPVRRVGFPMPEWLMRIKESPIRFALNERLLGMNELSLSVRQLLKTEDGGK